jgi:hypothetical protein
MTKITPGPFKKWPIFSKTFTMIVLILGIANAAHAAGKLVTPTLVIVAGNVALCSVVNASDNPVTIQTTLFGNLSGLLDSDTLVVPPNNVGTVSGGVSQFNEFMFCTFDVIDGNKKNIRAGLNVVDLTQQIPPAFAEAR